MVEKALEAAMDLLREEEKTERVDGDDSAESLQGSVPLDNQRKSRRGPEGGESPIRTRDHGEHRRLLLGRGAHGFEYGRRRADEL